MKPGGNSWLFMLKQTCSRKLQHPAGTDQSSPAWPNKILSFLKLGQKGRIFFSSNSGWGFLSCKLLSRWPTRSKTLSTTSIWAWLKIRVERVVKRSHIPTTSPRGLNKYRVFTWGNSQLVAVCTFPDKATSCSISFNGRCRSTTLLWWPFTTMSHSSFWHKVCMKRRKWGSHCTHSCSTLSWCIGIFCLNTSSCSLGNLANASKPTLDTNELK